MSRSSGPRRSTTRLRLYEAAAALVAEQGFAATTVEEIAERAGVAKGTVYYHFEGRDEFFEELLKHCGERFTGALREAADRERARGAAPGAVLDAVVRAGLAFVRRRPAYVRLYTQDLWRPSPETGTGRPARPDAARQRRAALAVIEEALRETAAGPDGAPEGGPAQGMAPVPAEIALTAAGVLGMVVATALDWQMSQPQRSLEEVHAALRPILPLRTPATAG